jgi:hypothetical protein
MPSIYRYIVREKSIKSFFMHFPIIILSAINFLVKALFLYIKL